jgi:hypothetical protein
MTPGAYIPRPPDPVTGEMDTPDASQDRGLVIFMAVYAALALIGYGGPAIWLLCQ